MSPRFDSTGRPPHELGPSFVPWVNVQNAPFRARGDGSTHDKVAINNAIEAMAAIVPSTAGETFGGGKVYLPRGHYSIDSITMRYGVRIVGDGPQATKLVARAGSASPGMVLLDAGVVAYSWMEHVALIGAPGNTGQHGMYLHAQPTMQAGATQGGWWSSGLRNITVEGFDGEGIWLHGGGDTFDGPHQFLTFDKVQVASPMTHGRALRVSGEVNQVDFIGSCQFNGVNKTTGTEVVKLERTVNTSGVNNGDIAPNTFHWGLTSIQSGKRLMTIERASAQVFFGTHFEEGDEGIYVDQQAQNVIVHGCYAGNVGHDGSGTGFFLKVNLGSARSSKNRFAASSALVAPDKHYIRQSGGVLTLDGTHDDDTGIRTAGCTLQINAAGTLVLTGFSTVFVNTSGTSITTITKLDAAPASMLVIKAHNGPITLASGGNIYFDSSPNRYKSPLTVPADTVVLLVKVDLGGQEWLIVAGAENANNVRPFGCNGATPQASFTVGAPPALGGAGTAAGGFDTPGHRDQLIATVSALRTMAINNGEAV